MKKMKKLLCLVLVLTLAVGFFVFPAAADNEKTRRQIIPLCSSTDLWAGAKDRI